MKTIKFLTLITVFASIVSLTSCSKGDTGPAGPAGPTGAQGNANVTGQQFTVTSWSNNGTYYYVDFDVSALSSDILSGGAVEVYLSINGGTNWAALPFDQYGSSANYIWNYVTGLNLVEPHWIYNGAGLGSDPNTFYGASCEFNVVCIAPAAINVHPNINWNNAAEVAQLPEVQAYLYNKK